MKSPSPRPLADFQAQLAALSSALDHFLARPRPAPATARTPPRLSPLADRLGKQDQGHVDLPEIMELSPASVGMRRAIWPSPLSKEDLALGQPNSTRRRWVRRKLWRRMLVAPCWQWAAAPVLDEVSGLLWSQLR